MTTDYRTPPQLDGAHPKRYLHYRTQTCPDISLRYCEHTRPLTPHKSHPSPAGTAIHSLSHSLPLQPSSSFDPNTAVGFRRYDLKSEPPAGQFPTGFFHERRNCLLLGFCVSSVTMGIITSQYARSLALARSAFLFCFIITMLHFTPGNERSVVSKFGDGRLSYREEGLATTAPPSGCNIWPLRLMSAPLMILRLRNLLKALVREQRLTRHHRKTQGRAWRRPCHPPHQVVQTEGFCPSQCR